MPRCRRPSRRRTGDFRHFNLQFGITHIEPANPRATARLIAELAPRHDGLVICSAHHDEIAAALAEVSGQGKPVITLATDIRGGGRHTYVGPDNWKAGRVAGDLMGRLLGPGGGEVVMIAGHAQHDRPRGARDGLPLGAARALSAVPACRTCCRASSAASAPATWCSGR